MRYCALFSILIAVCSSFVSSVIAGEIKPETRQVILGLADHWDSSQVTLAHYERGPLGRWNKVGTWSGRLGKNGLAWGIGLHDIPAGAKMKREGDGRTPAGMFDIGLGAFGYAPTIKKKPTLFYHQITSRSLWYETENSPYYNSFRIINHEPRTVEEKKAQMRQGDPAHSLKLFIAHNAPPQAQPGYGSSIFFHIWRDNGAVASAGCTTMAEQNLKAMISHIDPSKIPRYVVLPKSEYQRVKGEWLLP